MEELYSQFVTTAENFRWEAGKTSLTDVKFVGAVWVTYWCTIAALQKWMSGRPPFALKWVTPLHNLILCLWSAIMFYWMVVDISKIVHKNSGQWNEVFCLSETAALDRSDKIMNAFWFHVYIYYISKFYELFDTVILVLKKRDVIFLHWYHHSIVIAMVWAWLEYRIPFCSLGTLFNTLVHVFMYYYYMCAALKWNVWFKRYITKFQIVQFISSFFLSLGFIYFYVSEPQCQGLEAFLFSCACNASFLYLFLQFDTRTYSTKNDAKSE